ncbi:uncharacterized protein LOC133189918 isoform X2 [Saccostrea echinata]|uniref:uncharacterized protein LOC133189918 isoform X2 n=1 Tax=Saccostrea echinata TaxID=191078 RepID=UPI002A7F91E1|nr:uncharacterized protein LOC133189918 isoform X2 [Saccostrea echinata]
MSCYQKFYTNQIHSSSLLCQLATMWKSQVLCDAVIRTGPVITKAHRVVLVAACPMLQSMDNASMGSHLEVRLAADIKQDSINTFLQYLYEGFMMLTEENCRDVEKIARLLQVDSVIKCCADFLKCLNGATGAPMPMDSQYKYTSYDMLEFRHVRSSGLQKSVNMKRMSNFPRPVSPGSKRQRMGRPSSPLVDSHSSSHRADDTLSMAHSYRSSQPDPWDRVPQLGAGTRLPTQPGVIDIVEDCLEIIQTEEPEKDARGNVKPDSRPKQKSVSIGVSSQMNTATDVHVVNISDPGGTAGPPKQTTTNGSRGSITVNPLTMFNDPTSSSQGLQRSDTSNDVQFSPRSVESEAARKENFPHAMTPPQQPVFPTMTPISRATNKPFAAGSATQVHPSESGGKTQAESEEGDQAQDQVNRVESQELSPSSSSDKAPDISIVKVEAADAHTGGLDMYVDIPEDGIMRMKSGIEESIENEEESDPEHDQSQDALRDDMSNEASNVSGDQNNSWYIGQFKEWLLHNGYKADFEMMDASKLNRILCHFYGDAVSISSLPLAMFPPMLTLHLSSAPFYRNIDIENDTEFRSSNSMISRNPVYLDDAERTEVGSTNISITFSDLKKVYASSALGLNDRYTLQNKVWLDINLYFGGFTRQLLRNMSKKTFCCCTDLNTGRKYYKVHDPKVSLQIAARMYEQPGNLHCPVYSFELYLSKLNPESQVFFQQPTSYEEFNKTGCWYSTTPIGKNNQSRKLTSICQSVGMNLNFRNTSIRHLCRAIRDRYPEYTPSYSDRLFQILTTDESNSEYENMM